jgi:hypothetical protein
VEIADDLAITYDGKPLILCSESERFRVRVTLQVAMAALDQSAVIVVDAADILGKGGRNGLMRLLSTESRPALICMTMDAIESVPNLSQAGMGASYWMDGNVAHETSKPNG